MSPFDPAPVILIPVAGHFFSPEALTKAVSDAMLDHPGKQNILKGTVDSSGANVVLGMSSADGAWKIQTAFTHDWFGNNTFGAAGSIAW